MNPAVSATLVAQIAIAQLGAFVALLLLGSGAHKLRGIEGAVQAIGQLTGLAGMRARALALVLAGLEILAGLALWIAPLRLAGALLAVLIWSGYFVFLLNAVASGRSGFDCGCSFAGTHAETGLFQVVRAGVLALLAIIVAGSAAVAPGALAYDRSVAGLATELLAGLALLALYVAIEALMALRPLRAGVVL